MHGKEILEVMERCNMKILRDIAGWRLVMRQPGYPGADVSVKQDVLYSLESRCIVPLFCQAGWKLIFVMI